MGATWIPNPAFPYPLPLATLMLPLGLFPLDTAYALWIVLSVFAAAISLLLLISSWDDDRGKFYLLPILAGLAVFRPMLVTLRNGQLGAFLGLVVALVCFTWKRGNWLAGSAVLAMTLLKPTVGVPIVGLLS